MKFAWKQMQSTCIWNLYCIFYTNVNHSIWLSWSEPSINITFFTKFKGRRSVRYGDFQYCDQAKSVIVVSNMTYLLAACFQQEVLLHSFVILLLSRLFTVTENVGDTRMYKGDVSKTQVYALFFFVFIPII